MALSVFLEGQHQPNLQRQNTTSLEDLIETLLESRHSAFNRECQRLNNNCQPHQIKQNLRIGFLPLFKPCQKNFALPYPTKASDTAFMVVRDKSSPTKRINFQLSYGQLKFNSKPKTSINPPCNSSIPLIESELFECFPDALSHKEELEWNPKSQTMARTTYKCFEHDVLSKHRQNVEYHTDYIETLSEMI